MPAVFTSDGVFLHYQCDHARCQRTTAHPDTRRGAHYAWCQTHSAERLAVNYTALDDAYLSERDELRLTWLAYYPDGRPRASHLGPSELGIPLHAEADVRILQRWRGSADHLYQQIAKPINARMDHARTFYRGDSHIGQDAAFRLLIQEQAQLLRQMSDLDEIIRQRQRR
ncbi:hypothetical protein BOTBODRAFT_70679 [Botryobasidium botryosum FD-172 SS1]|uniref:Uncharacterized protein n=1 Tax=Botryobasidium botryosum (strain FD-172 SS1) TaxID=930990 RepID=A0A067LXA5_BOTB1|nr:hypothetical protein BOTBODRAFT_70679 [Botryobasidium botryosum FD-172 SS1]